MHGQKKTFLDFFGFAQGFLWIVLAVALLACPPAPYRAPLLDVTLVNLKNVKWTKTPRGASIWTPEEFRVNEYYQRVDEEISELSACLIKVGLRSKPIEHKRVYVYVPKDWYNSYCSVEQLIPSRIDYKLCEAKGLKIDEKCRTATKPTSECPCPCNARAAIAGEYVVATAPNLKLFKAELSRLVLYPKFNFPWVAPLSQCLQVGQ